MREIETKVSIIFRKLENSYQISYGIPMDKDSLKSIRWCNHYTISEFATLDESDALDCGLCLVVRKNSKVEI